MTEEYDEPEEELEDEFAFPEVGDIKRYIVNGKIEEYQFNESGEWVQI